jgi:hypothetical protein
MGTALGVITNLSQTGRLGRAFYTQTARELLMLLYTGFKGFPLTSSAFLSSSLPPGSVLGLTAWASALS